ncbi:uncharacterized protein LOC131005899 [Salvia miltiorrhiza]|uniref:uncharacterized protein LOC131005899 n=1 Tax=Salvia miltiorrhiza TaxID=226208 RepID=UPI0025AD62CE|nr:uncharacterized protein LOC131005899 [Salvia miltiorrhiza]
MPKRESKEIVEETPTISLRRSTRIHRQNQTGAQSPRTPKPAGTRRDSIPTPISKIKKTGHRVSENRRGREVEFDSEKFRSRSPDLGKQSVKEKRQTRSSVARCRSVGGSEKSGEGSRRSGRANAGKEEVVEKMLTRSSARRNKVGDSNLNTEESDVKFEKMVTRSSSKAEMKKVSNVPKGADELPERDTGEKDVEDCGIMKRNGEQNRARKARIGGKRKRDGVEGECEDARGWTEDQEIHLQSAYFSVKPTPHFWKKVARMVPGKSAQECFDKIYSDHLTPPPPRTRSRAKTKEPSPLSYSASKLIFPADRKTKRLGSKRRTLLAQKTVRKILQKQEDEDYSADLFALLEPTLDLSTVVLPEDTTFASPPPSKVSAFLAGRRPESSSSQGKKHLSRLKGDHKARLTSPPVLKQIKNKALHEKYIDQLHCRDAKRKAALRKSAQIDAKPICSNLVKAAKDALLSDAQDAIRSLQCRNNDDDDDDDDEDEEDEDDEDEGI